MKSSASVPKTIVHIDLCDDDIGEVQGMLLLDGTVLDWWSSNDGNWRGEYFDGFLRSLGIKVLYLRDKGLDATIDYAARLKEAASNA